MDSVSAFFEIPLRFVASHAISRPGFQSDRKAQFWHAGAALGAKSFTISDVELLGVELRRLAVMRRADNSYLLSLEFNHSFSLQDADDFIQRFVDAFTVSMAGDQRDPWYGNLLLESLWSGLRDSTPKPFDMISPEISTALTSEEFVPISEASLQALSWSPLTTIFADGMRAAQPKSKFLFWFVILEELESREEFKQLFIPLFSTDEKQQLLQAPLSGAARERLVQLLNNPSATQQGRAEKLLAILQRIGLGEVKSLDKTITVDLAICRSLIKQRNNIAHKGAAIDVDQLYTVLFPLAQGALDYLAKRQMSP